MKYKRRANGMGTVRKLSGNRRNPYVAYSPAKRGANGKYTKDVIGYYATQKEAENALALYRICPPSTDTNITLKALYEQWKETGYKNIGEACGYSYRAAWAKFQPIADMKVKDIKTPQFQYCIDMVAEQGASSSTLNNMRIIAKKLEKFAMQQDLIAKDYSQFITLPKADKKEKDIFTDFQLRKIEQGAKDGIGISKHILIMCYMGWRITEYCNLTVFDYDRSEHTLKGGAKTEAGKNRIVPLPSKIIPYVDELFENSERLYPYTSQCLRSEFYTTLTALGIQKENERTYTPHTCRHTYNSMLANLGVDVDKRMKLMGQTDAKTNVNVYTHFEVETLKKIVENL